MHMVEWLFEVMLMISKNSVSWNLIMTLYQMEFAVKSVCQAMSTETRRAVFLKVFSRLKSSALVLWMKMNFATKVRPQIQEDHELQSF